MPATELGAKQLLPFTKILGKATNTGAKILLIKMELVCRNFSRTDVGWYGGGEGRCLQLLMFFHPCTL